MKKMAMIFIAAILVVGLVFSCNGFAPAQDDGGDGGGGGDVGGSDSGGADVGGDYSAAAPDSVDYAVEETTEESVSYTEESVPVTTTTTTGTVMTTSTRSYGYGPDRVESAVVAGAVAGAVMGSAVAGSGKSTATVVKTEKVTSGSASVSTKDKTRDGKGTTAVRHIKKPGADKPVEKPKAVEGVDKKAPKIQ